MAGKFTAPKTPPDVQNDYMKKKQALEESFVEFHKLFMNKVLDINKSAATKKTEMSVVDKLVGSCVALEKISSGEGILALTIIALKEELTVRNRMNELEYMILKAQKEIETLKGGNNGPKSK